MTARLAGKFALVTGAGSGIGRAVAVRFAQEGARVAINDRAEDGGGRETMALAERASREAGHEGGHLVVVADISDKTAIATMFDRVLEAFGRLDLLVNNAGIQREKPSHELTVEDYETVVGVNLTGAVMCATRAISHFLSRPGGGVILNCSSVHQAIPKPGYLPYAVSKSGLDGLTRTLALEYADRGIRVNAVGPGAVATDINRRWLDDPEARRGVEGHIPMGRVAEPEEIAAAFAFLASDEAAYITGQTLYVCGGLTLYGEFRENWSS